LATAHYLAYSETRRFSSLVLDYLSGQENLAEFYQFTPDITGLAEAIEQRRNFPVDRETLHKALQEQYHHLPKEAAVDANIQRILDTNTFTVCTAHQPNLATGYLYFIYKILHAIRLCRDLKVQYPESNFVPVYYMGSEDADLEELGTFRFGTKKFVWDADGQTGAVGRMDSSSLAPLLQQLFSLMGPPGPEWEELRLMLRQAYSANNTISAATISLVHHLFGRYGLIIFQPDDSRFKKAFIPVMEEDLIGHTAEQLVQQTIRKFEAKHFKAQAQPRAINLFYLKDNIRDRIEQKGDHWQVVGTSISWNQTSLLLELHEYPERFSPNVVLRPLYQESILPNIAFIGGGAEVAYWLQLKSLFQHHQVFYPTILLRQSVLWVNSNQRRLWHKTRLSLQGLFAPEDQAVRDYVQKHAQKDWQTKDESLILDQLAERLRLKALDVDATLGRSADAAITKMKHQLERLEQKMLRAEKRQLQTGLEQLQRLHKELFPNAGLQERVENFMPYFLMYGRQFFEDILEHLEPLRNEFLVLEEEGNL